MQDLMLALSPVSMVVVPLTFAGPHDDPVPGADDLVEASQLVGVWEAHRSYGPEIRGPLTIQREGERWRAEIGPHRVHASEDAGWVTFELPGDRGRFRGRLEEEASIHGHWTQPATRHAGMPCASPVSLDSVGPDTWRGEVLPLDDLFTVFLVIEEREDGTAAAFLRNPDRNWGVFARADRVETSGNEVRLVGRWRGSDEGDETVLSRGHYSAWNDSFTLSLRGSTFDFRRIDQDPASAFYARGRDPEPWTYQPPPALDDGWNVGTLEEVGLSLAPLRALIHEVIDPPAASVSAPYVHGMLIARHGKLVLEEYFHGFHRGVPHDTRSASKSLTSFLVGAAIEAGEPVELSTPVYETIGAPYHRDTLDPRAQAMTLEHLLTMTSGLNCDDSDPDSPGNEELLQSQAENPDWYDFTLALDMVREPGEEAVYCSVNPNLAGKVLSAATGRALEDLLLEHVARPLDFGRYHLYLQPTGEPYQGGGSFFLARDFLKLAQVLVDDGTWNGQRIVSSAFAHDSADSLVDLRGRDYGYLWWVADLPYRDGTVRAFYAGGNGGQVVMGIPELDLTVLFFAGNYSDRVMYRIQEELVPEYVLRAVE